MEYRASSLGINPVSASDGGKFSPHVVIVNWNLPDDTLACVHSLLSEGFAPSAIWVVDNGSTDGSPERLAAYLPTQTHLIQSRENLGFAGGNNIGIRTALDAGAEWVLLLNNDTIVQSGMLNALADACTAAPDVRLWGPVIFYAAEPGIVWSAGDRLMPGTLATRSLWRNRTLPASVPAIVRVDFLTACAILVHAEVFHTVGLLDSRYFMYAEDGDFCQRARNAGFTLACATQATVLHKVSRSTGTSSPVARTWRVGNMARFYRDHARGLKRVLMFGFSTTRTLLLTAQDLLAGRRALVAAAWQGWAAGWFGDPTQPIGRRPHAGDRVHHLPATPNQEPNPPQSTRISASS